MVARRTSSAGFVAGARPDGFVGALRRADYYKRLPLELAEGSVVGGAVSVVATAAFAALLVAQTRALRQVGTRTDIVVDHEPDRRFQVNFKLELPELSCEWATVDVVDALGARRFNVTGEQLYKHAMGASHYLGVEHVTENAGTKGSNTGSIDDDSHDLTTDLDAYGDARVAYEITAATFDRMVAAHRVLLVNFHAPWCSHCTALRPVFEHAADLVRQDLKTSGTARLAAALASVDCTLDANARLCAEQKVQAFPTLRLYRGGKNGETHSLSGDDSRWKSDGSERALPRQLQFEAKPNTTSFLLLLRHISRIRRTSSGTRRSSPRDTKIASSMNGEPYTLAGLRNDHRHVVGHDRSQFFSR
jgi:acyl-coenzyme A thioesterase 9